MHLYIHVPFCARRCSYCDFAIAVRRETPSAAFGASVEREWRARQNDPGWALAPRLETIYFGGGTPSRLDPAVLESLLRRFRADREIVAGAEITLEANPDDLTPEHAAAWRVAGVNRISIGAQAFSAPALEWMHRTHRVEQIESGVKTLRGAGFDNLSLDLIYALPDAISRDWSHDLDRALALEPSHLSLYALTVETGTPLDRWTARGESLPVADARAAEEFLSAHHRLREAGYEHYEVSNAARPGFRAAHNSAYWRRRPFLGLGPSAHSGAGAIRSWNVREWEDYRRRSERGDSVLAASETLDAEQIALEELYLGLRTSDGVPESRVPRAEAEKWIREGWAMKPEGRLRLTPEGWLRLDALVASLTHC